MSNLNEKPVTIEVNGTFGPKQVTKEEFVEQWEDHARQLHQLDWDHLEEMQAITQRIKEIAGAKFDKLAD